MTGRIIYTPEAAQQLRDLEEWIADAASQEIARTYVARVLDHIERILLFPLAGRPRDDLRPGVRTTSLKGRTVIAYEVDESAGVPVVTILGVSHGGQDWESALGEDRRPAEG